MKDQEKILKALANRRRLEILKLLKDKKEETVGDLARKIKLSVKATSKHVTLLSRANLIEREQRSVLVYYSLQPRLEPIAKGVISLL
jgi:ArsR family transcriptional regulator